MGFLNWFKPKPPPISTEFVWISAPAKNRAILRDIQNCLQADAAVVLLAHFSETLRILQAELSDQNIPFEPRPTLYASQLDAFARQQAPAKLLTALTSTLHFDKLPDGLPKRTITLIIAERHPLRTKDNVIEDFAGGVPTKLRIHVSLDDDLLKLFASPNIIEILRKLGMEDDQPISSPTVTNAIRSAQQKIESKTIGDRDAPSADAWLRLNCSP